MKTNAATVNRCIPVWLHDVLLGYGDPSAANFKSERIKMYSSNTVGVTPLSAPLDFGDTFVDDRHLQESFQGADIAIVRATKVEGKVFSMLPPGLTYVGPPPLTYGSFLFIPYFTVLGRQNYKLKFVEEGTNIRIEATPYPFPINAYTGNQVPFTPVQVEAIRSGLSSGLTLLVGPPGTGKFVLLPQKLDC